MRKGIFSSHTVGTKDRQSPLSCHCCLSSAAVLRRRRASVRASGFEMKAWRKIKQHVMATFGHVSVIQRSSMWNLARFMIFNSKKVQL